MNITSIYNRFAVAVVLCLFITAGASAQQLIAVTGIIFKKSTPQTISQVTISNLNRKTIGMSDELGGFNVKAAMGDTLLFNKADYSPQYIVVVNTNITVFMSPNILLNEVTIKDISKRQELSDAMDDYKKKGQYYTLNPSAMSVVSSPLTGLYELFGKSAAQARRFRKYTKDELERVEVAKRYNRPLVKKTVNIADDDLDAFMLAFSPSYEDIKVWTDYDIINYIKKSYEYFQDNKDRLKVDRLY